jgi:hypothetical protein
MCIFKMVLKYGKVTTVQVFKVELQFIFIFVVARRLCCLEF